MPALTLPLIGFACGVLLAWAAAEELAQRQLPSTTRSAWIVALYGLLVQGPVAAVVLTHNADWSLCYYVNSTQLHPAVVPALVVWNVAMPSLGFVLAAKAASRPAPLKALRLGLAPAAIALTLVTLTLPRLLVVGSHNQFHNDFGTRSLGTSPTGYLVLFLAALGAAALAWTWSILKRLGRQTPPISKRLSWLQ